MSPATLDDAFSMLEKTDWSDYRTVTVEQGTSVTAILAEWDVMTVRIDQTREIGQTVRLPFGPTAQLTPGMANPAPGTYEELVALATPPRIDESLPTAMLQSLAAIPAL